MSRPPPGVPVRRDRGGASEPDAAVGPASGGLDPSATHPDDVPPLIQPGGKVDPEAVRAAYERARDEGDDDYLARVRFELQRDLQSRLDKYLVTRVTFMSRSALQRLIEGGGATVNGRSAKASTKLRGGDVVELIIPQPPSGEITPEDIPLDVLVEDEHLIVIDKPADIIVHPARSELCGTMVNALAWRFRNVSGGELSPVGEEFARPGVVHRLDRHTSGCIVFAKTEEAHWKIGRQFENRTVDKRYLAVVEGRVEPDFQVIDLPLGPHPSKAKGAREKRVVRHDDLGKPSVTLCRVRERYTLPDGRRFSLVELELKTGRTHQIRVHLSYLGHPIVGDDMYGGRAGPRWSTRRVPFPSRDSDSDALRQGRLLSGLGVRSGVVGFRTGPGRTAVLW
jgi:23S rRNA pseudouridine1911/1915/1917 synthase